MPNRLSLVLEEAQWHTARFFNYSSVLNWDASKVVRETLAVPFILNSFTAQPVSTRLALKKKKKMLIDNKDLRHYIKNVSTFDYISDDDYTYVRL